MFCSAPGCKKCAQQRDLQGDEFGGTPQHGARDQQGRTIEFARQSPHTHFSLSVDGLAQLPGRQPIVGKQGVDDASWIQFFSHGVGFRLATRLSGMALR